MAPSTTTRRQARTHTTPISEITEPTRRQPSEPSTQPRANPGVTMATNNAEPITQPTEEGIALSNTRVRASSQNRRSDDAAEDSFHLAPNTSGSMILSNQSRSEFEDFTRQHRTQLRATGRSENLSDLSVDMEDLESITAGDLDAVINEANKDKLANFGIPSPPATPSREVSPEPEERLPLQFSAPPSPLLSPQTSDESNDDIFSDSEVEIDDLAVTETHHEDPSRPSLQQISPQSNRLQEEANRRRPAFPNYLMDEYLEDAFNFERSATRQTFTERHRENIRPATEPNATTGTTTTTVMTTNISNIDGADSWIDPEDLWGAIPASTQVTPQRPATRQQRGIDQANRHLFPLQSAMAFRSLR
ncbi:hypothetical protein ONS96_002663 [Cadophora gregata f. sp. sojae]|nr:hypothetical protein ONS96_002663 [Cadophora gregata f. sp. sojae]